MRRINHYLLYASLFVAMCVWFGCSTKEEFIPELNVTVTNAIGVESKQLTFDEKGGLFSIAIKSNSHWSIGSQSNWITLSHHEGVGDQQVNATIASATESRNAVITIYLKEYKQEKVSIDVLQHVTVKPEDSEDGEQGGDDNNEDEEDNDQNQPDNGDNDDSDSNEPSDPDQGEDENGDGDEDGDKDGDKDGSEDGDGNGNNNGDGNGDNDEGGNKDDDPEEQPEEPSHKEPQPITIESLIALMTEDMKSVVIDNECDRVFSAIVMNDTEGNNFYPNHLMLCNEGAISANNGITLSGKVVRPAELGLKMGDKVEVTLKAKNAVAIKYKGRYEITGEVGTEWVSLKVLSSNNKITPIEVTPKVLSSYQAMTVTLKDVTPTTSGRWHNTENKGYTEFTSSDGSTFSVFVATEALFSANEFHITNGNLTGIVVVENNVAMLYPRNLSDVYDFNGASPEEDNNEGSDDGNDNGSDDSDEGGEDDSENEGDNDNNESGENDSDGNDDNPDEGDSDKGTDDEDEGGDENQGDENQGDGNQGEDKTDNEDGEDNENGDDNDDTNETENGEPYTLVDELSKLQEGKYYIGGYKESTLYLATGSLTDQNHCVTKSFNFSNGDITPLEGVDPAIIKLIASDAENGYYIEFPNGKYLIATDNSAGALSLSDTKSRYWIFSEHGDGGFILKQSGDKNVKLIVSKRAKSDILRSVDGDESGGAVVFIRIN